MIIQSIRRNFFVKMLVMMVLCTYGVILLGTPVALAAHVIPAGTKVIVKPVEDISPDKFNVGDSVKLTVVSDVAIGGITVIKAGETALGEVTTSIKRGNVGSSAKIGITIRSVKAVDGKTVALTGTKVVEGKDKQAESILITILCCILALFMKGGNAVITTDAQIEATVLTDVEVAI